MKSKTILYIIAGVCAVGVIGLIIIGIMDNNATPEPDTKTEEVFEQSNCTIEECIKQIEVANSVEEINKIIGFDGNKNDYSDDYTWKLDSKNWITRKNAGDSHIIQATIDKDSIKNESLSLPTSAELKKWLDDGSFTYEKLVEKLGGAKGTMSSKTSTSVGYTWVDKNSQTLSATFNNESKKCTVASIR